MVEEVGGSCRSGMPGNIFKALAFWCSIGQSNPHGLTITQIKGDVGGNINVLSSPGGIHLTDP